MKLKKYIKGAFVIVLLVSSQFHSVAQSHIYLNVNQPSKLIAFAGIDQLICANTTASLSIGATIISSGGTPSFSYNWMPNANLSSNTSANPLVLPSVTTNYTLTVTDANGCTAKDTMLFTVDNCTGLQNVTNETKITLNPNIINDKCFVNITSSKMDTPLTLTIYDMGGKMIHQEIFLKDSLVLKKEIDVSSYSNGAYYLMIQCESNYFSGKFLKN